MWPPLPPNCNSFWDEQLGAWIPEEPSTAPSRKTVPAFGMKCKRCDTFCPDAERPKDDKPFFCFLCTRYPYR